MKIAGSAGMGLEETETRREAQEGGSHKVKEEGARNGRRERGNDFGVTFQVFSKKNNLRTYLRGHLGVEIKF